LFIQSLQPFDKGYYKAKTVTILKGPRDIEFKKTNVELV